MASNELVVRLVGDTKSLDRALSRASRTAPTKMQRIGKAAGALGIALGVGLAAAAKVGFDEIQESQKVMAQTQAVLKSTGGAANVTAGHVADLATSLAEMSGISDEAIQSGENLLLTFKNIRNGAEEDEKFFDQATRAALDLSVALGKDMNTSALMVGKALNDPVKGLTALGRAGVQFTDKQKKTIKALVESGNIMDAQEIILAELESQVGGSAEAYGKTLPGQIGKAKESFQNLAGEIMVGALPVIQRLVDAGQRAIAWAKENPGLVKALAIALGVLAGALIAASVAQTLLNLAVLANPFVAAVVAVVALGAALVVAYKKSEKFRAVVDAVVNFVKEHWEKLLFAFGLLPGVIVQIIKHWGTLKNVGLRVFGAIRGVVQTVRDAIQNVINKVKSVIEWIRDKLGSGPVRAAITRLIGPFNRLLDAVSGVIGAVKDLIGWIRAIPDIGTSVPGGRQPVGPGSRPGRSNPNRNTNALVPSGLQRGTVTSGVPGGLVMVLTTREIANFLQGAQRDYGRANGGRSIL